MFRVSFSKTQQEVSELNPEQNAGQTSQSFKSKSSEPKPRPQTHSTEPLVQSVRNLRVTVNNVQDNSHNLRFVSPQGIRIPSRRSSTACTCLAVQSCVRPAACPTASSGARRCRAPPARPSTTTGRPSPATCTATRPSARRRRSE